MSIDDLAEHRADMESFMEDHIPEATTDQSDTPELRCSCGWEDKPWDRKALGWVDHLLAALKEAVR